VLKSISDWFDKKHFGSHVAAIAFVTVAGTAISSIVAWLLSPGFRSFSSSAFHAAARGLFAVLGWLFDHRRDIGMLLIGALLAVCFLARYVYRWGRRVGESAERQRVDFERAREEALRNVMLEPEERRVMETLGQADGAPLSVGYFQDEFGWGWVQTTNFLESLIRRGLVTWHHHPTYGQRAILTDRGLAYVTNQGLIPRGG
jgi:hypothetical protein